MYIYIWPHRRGEARMVQGVDGFKRPEDFAHAHLSHLLLAQNRRKLVVDL